MRPELWYDDGQGVEKEVDSKDINKVKLKGILEQISWDRVGERRCELKGKSMVSPAMNVQGNFEMPVENPREMLEQKMGFASLKFNRGP